MRIIIIIWSVLTTLLTAVFCLNFASLPPEHFGPVNPDGSGFFPALTMFVGSLVMLLFYVLFFGAIIRSLWRSRKP